MINTIIFTCQLKGAFPAWGTGIIFPHFFPLFSCYTKFPINCTIIFTQSIESESDWSWLARFCSPWSLLSQWLCVHQGWGMAWSSAGIVQLDRTRTFSVWGLDQPCSNSMGDTFGILLGRRTGKVWSETLYTMARDISMSMSFLSGPTSGKIFSNAQNMHKYRDAHSKL
jgi:hypothetical protein